MRKKHGEPAREGKEGGEGRGRAYKVSPARRAAFEILRRVEEEGAFSSFLLAAADEELSAADRALCYELVLGALRWQLWLDQLIEHYARRSAARLDAPVRRALRLGLYQLRFLTRIPPSAAVNEAVNLARAARVGSAAGFVNAVLRRATREPEYDPAARLSEPLERIAVATSHPVWLIERWTRMFGAEETERFARANNEAPPVAFRLNPLRPESAGALERLRAAGARLMPSSLAPEAWRVEGGGALLRELARAGLIYMQDEASQLVAHVLGARKGERVLDACAAPGSKTTHIAALAGDEALVVACDLYPHRLRVVVESAARLGLKRVVPLALDAERALPFPEEAFDCVLVDAPCTGTGTLRRNPEIRWRITARDMADLAARQQRILRQAARGVRHGGRLVYSTCSVEPEENEEVIAAFQQAHARFALIAPEAVPATLLTASGAARVWPHREGADGFFIAAYERRG